MKQLLHQLDSQLLQQTRTLSRYTMLLQSHLPPECSSHYQIATMKGSTLVVTTDSPVWTTRLRQLAPDIVSIMQRNNVPIQHVQVITRFNTKIEPIKQRTVKRQLSQKTRHHLEQASSYIDDEQLSAALKKLAQRSKKRV